jgi:membrane-bound lytic murein transglycosylase
MARTPGSSGFRFSNLKLANQITLIAGFLSLTILAGLIAFSGRFSNQSMTTAVETSFRAQVDGLRRAVDLVYELAVTQVGNIAEQFDNEYRAATVDENQTVSIHGVEMPVVKLRGTDINHMANPTLAGPSCSARTT